MKALILAGGFGTRLRPLTYTRPKHLLPIANRPHIDLVLDLLQEHGVDEVVLTTSYLAEAFRDTVDRARARGLTVDVTHEEQALGTAGALKHAEAVLGDETFLALNGDVLTDADLTRLVEFHRSRAAKATILLTRVEDPSAFGVVPTEDDGRVSGFVEKPPPGEAPTDLINAGVYVLEPSVLERVPDGVEWSSERQLFPELAAEGDMYALHLDEYWIDIGTPEKYLQANMDAMARGAVPVSRLADVARDAHLSDAVVAPGCTVGSGARLERCVLLPGVTVGEGAQISDSILGEDVRVDDGVRLAGATVADGEVVSEERVQS